jgi:hypothetical protein
MQSKSNLGSNDDKLNKEIFRIDSESNKYLKNNNKFYLISVVNYCYIEKSRFTK